MEQNLEKEREAIKASQEKEIEERKGIVRSSAHIILDLDKSLYEEARQQIIGKFLRHEKKIQQLFRILSLLSS